MNSNNKSSKALLLGTIILIILIVIVIPKIKNFRQEEKLKKDINEISSMFTSNPNYEELYNRLDNMITKGKIINTEKATKSYMKDLVVKFNSITDIVYDEKTINILSSNNLKKDKPNFYDTKEYINNIIKRLENLKDEYSTYCSTDVILSYAEKFDLSGHYLELYKYLINNEGDCEKLNKEIDGIIIYLKNEEKVIEFLSDNSSEWQIENDKIVFNNQELIDKYNNLLKGI